LTVWFKQGVCGTLSPMMRRCKGRLVQLYQRHNKDFYITSIRDSNHADASCHYEGDALDFKRQGLQIHLIIAEAGRGFDVVEYSDARDIFHVEWDPK